MTSDRGLDPETLSGMLGAVRPDWELLAATAEDRGHTAVYQLDVATEDGDRELVLKASPGDEAHGIVVESRLLGLLAERTGIPVPGVLGAVDDHPALPSPFFLMESVTGTAMAYQSTRRLDDAVLRRLAVQTGRYLGELHGLDVVDAYGVVGVDRSGADGPTRADVAAFHVRDPIESWPGFLRASVEPELERLGTSRFADRAAAIRARVDEGLEALGPVGAPTLGRIDHGVHNLLLRPGDGEIEALIDWEFALAVTPGYDLRTVEYVLSGAVLAPLGDASDRRRLVRAAMAEGYRETARYPAAELEAAGELYELMAVVRAMNHLEAGVAKVPDGSEDVVAEGLRSAAERLMG